jgi:hypothetical protein
MSSVCIEKPVAGNSGEAMTTDCRTRGSQRKLIVVALLAVFLPFVVTQSYLYYMNPDAPAQVAAFFRGKMMPSSSSSSTQQDHEVPLYVCNLYPTSLVKSFAIVLLSPFTLEVEVSGEIELAICGSFILG